ncbi:ABC transporter substrate-binding protein [Microbacterium sp. gxy059]|uniref:ABC transporter substrate-binding protein n=1 Tax=Microbacterium sp. gxy059 TaxID=2957199 RepID=UPI003D974505
MISAPTRGRRFVAGLATAATAATLLLTGCTADQGAGGASDALLTIPREDMGTFSRNFNPFSPNAAPMTQQAIYESMLIYNPADGTTTPWLAESWDVADDGLSITFHLRDGVSWSDGEPLTAEDVATTFALQQEIVEGSFPYVSAVEATDEATVVFTFSTPFSPGLFEVGQQVIVPDHIWASQEDPDKFENKEPIGTGPFTEVSAFQTQSFDLLPNPHYWQEDRVQIPGVRMLAFAGNEGANLAAINGDVDWAPQFIPDIQKTYVDKDPENRTFWFPPTGSMVNWQLNTTDPRFENADVRKALSLAIDREQIVEVGMSGYTEPADCSGLSGSYETWKDESLLESCDWIGYDPDEAAALLDEAGFELEADGTRTTPDGEPFAFDISVGSASTDWLSVANIISQNLSDIGVTVNVDAPDWAAVTSDYEQGTFDTGIVWSDNAPTPYQYYRALMSSETLKPVGEQTFSNYHRFSDPAADELLQGFAASGTEEDQHAVVDELQALYLQDAPVIPLFPGPEWGAYTEARFTGWPTEADPYATLSTRAPTTVLVLTSLQPAD